MAEAKKNYANIENIDALLGGEGVGSLMKNVQITEKKVGDILRRLSSLEAEAARREQAQSAEAEGSSAAETAETPRAEEKIETRVENKVENKVPEEAIEKKAEIKAEVKAPEPPKAVEPEKKEPSEAEAPQRANPSRPKRRHVRKNRAKRLPPSRARKRPRAARPIRIKTGANSPVGTAALIREENARRRLRAKTVPPTIPRRADTALVRRDRAAIIVPTTVPAAMRPVRRARQVKAAIIRPARRARDPVRRTAWALVPPVSAAPRLPHPSCPHRARRMRPPRKRRSKRPIPSRKRRSPAARS